MAKASKTLSITDINAQIQELMALKEKVALESIAPMIAKYEAKKLELDQLAAEIKAINPSWSASSNEGLAVFQAVRRALKSKAHSLDELVTATGKPKDALKDSLDKAVVKGSFTLANGQYSLKAA